MRPLTPASAFLNGLPGLAMVCAVGVIATGPLDARTVRIAAHHAARHAALHSVRSARRPARPQPPAAVPVALRRPAPAGGYPPDRIPVALDYRISQDGPVGSIGIHRPPVDPWATPQPGRGLAAALRLDTPQPTLGASVTVPFK